MLRTGVDHVDLVVSSLEQSLPLYRELLGRLGYDDENEIAGERGERVVYLSGTGVVSIGLREAQSFGGHDRYAVGLHHLALEAPSRSAVDELLRWAQEQGLHIENEPREWHYTPGYYAGFFHDPDGIKLEVLHVPELERSEMSTTPPGDQERRPMPGGEAPAGSTVPPQTGGSAQSPFGNMPDMARLPIPGNAEFLLYAVALLLAALVVLVADALGSRDWFTFFTITTAVYILSRGIAKASRVLEQ